MKCKNCQEDLSGKQKFCSNCGQKNIEKLNVKFLLSNFLDNYLNFDSKLFRTLKYLVFKPGMLSKEYLEGKRVKFAPPVRMYIVLSLLFFFIISVIDTGTQQENDSSFIEESNISIDGKTIDKSVAELRRMDIDGTLDNYLDTIGGESKFRSYLLKKLTYAKIQGKGFSDVMVDQVSLFLLFFIPLLALLYATCFSRNKYGYVGHLVFNLHLNSFIIFVLTINQLVQLLIDVDELGLYWLVGIFLIMQAYLIVAVKKFYERAWWVVMYKYFLLLFGYFVLAVVFFFAVIIASLVVA